MVAITGCGLMLGMVALPGLGSEISEDLVPVELDDY